MAKFLSAMPNIISVYPRLPEWLASVLCVLYDLNAIKFHKLVLHEKLTAKATTGGEEDVMPLVETYYRLMAQFLLQLSPKFEGPDNMETFFNSFYAQFTKMKPLILEENLFEEIEASLGNGQVSQVIRAILEQDKAKYLAAVGAK